MEKVVSMVVALAAFASPSAAKSEPFVLGPPNGDGPVVVRASFEVRDINDIDDEAETFEFGGVLKLTWHDERQAFDPVEAGVDEKIYQGGYQFNELPPVLAVTGQDARRLFAATPDEDAFVFNFSHDPTVSISSA